MISLLLATGGLDFSEKKRQGQPEERKKLEVGERGKKSQRKKKERKGRELYYQYALKEKTSAEWV